VQYGAGHGARTRTTCSLARDRANDTELGDPAGFHRSTIGRSAYSELSLIDQAEYDIGVWKAGIYKAARSKAAISSSAATKRGEYPMPP